MKQINEIIDKLKEVKDSVIDLHERVQGYVDKDKSLAAENDYTYSKKEKNQIDELEDISSNLEDLSEFINEDIEYLDDIFKHLNEDVEEILERILK